MLWARKLNAGPSKQKGGFVRKCIFMMTCLILLFACTSSPDNAILGKWENISEKSSATIEFLKDGTLILGNKETAATAKYRILDKNRMEWIRSDGDTKLIEFKFVENELLLIAEGDEGHFRKIKMK